jgi:hypothetical protein
MLVVMVLADTQEPDHALLLVEPRRGTMHAHVQA